MADDNGSTSTGMGYSEDDFNDVDLNGMSALIDADAAQVPTWRKQASAYRGIAELSAWHKTEFDKHLGNTGDAWSSAGAQVFFTETADVVESLRLTAQDADLNATALDGLADAAVTAKSKVDKVKAEWADMEAKYQQNPHIFDGYAIDGSPGYQAAKASYEQTARQHMREYSTTAVQNTYAGMHPTGDYKGPLTGKTPVYPIAPQGPTSGDGTGRSGGSGGYPSPVVSSGSVNPTRPTDSSPTPPPTRPGSPVVEFPTPGGTTPPGSILNPPLPGTVSPGVGSGPYPPAVPGGFPLGRGPSGVRGVPPMPRATSPFAPRQSALARATEPVIGQRSGANSMGRNGRPKAGPVRPERGVIRNPNATGSQAGKGNRRRDDEDDRSVNGSDFVDNELLEGLPLDAGPAVYRPGKSVEVRRRDAGPALGRESGS